MLRDWLSDDSHSIHQLRDTQRRQIVGPGIVAANLDLFDPGIGVLRTRFGVVDFVEELWDELGGDNLTKSRVCLYVINKVT